MSITAIRESEILLGYNEAYGTQWSADPDARHFPREVPVERVTSLFDWPVYEADLTASALTPTGVYTIPVPGKKALVRGSTGHILGIHSTGYRVHPYGEWLVGNVANLLDADLKVARAGLLKQGAVAFVQIEMAETMSVGEIEYRPFLTAATSHDGSIASTYFTGAMVVICRNTLNAALKGAAEKIRIRHTANSELRLSDARQALDIVHQVGDDFAAEVEALSAQVISDDQWSEFLDAYTKRKTAKEGRGLTMATTKAASLDYLWKHDERVAPWAGSAWGVVQALNTYRHHVVSVRGDREERNALNAVTGKTFADDQAALTLLASL